MADDKSEDVEMDGDEEGSVISESEAGETASATSVRQAEPSQASVQQPVKSQTTVPELSPTSAPEKSQTSVPEPLPISEPEISQAAIAEKSQMSPPNKSQTSIRRESQISVDQVDAPINIGAQSQMSVKFPDKSAISLPYEDAEEQPDFVFGEESAEEGIREMRTLQEEEPPRYIEPLGVATDEALLENDLKPWILDKLFHEGRMGRYGLATIGGDIKLEKGGSTKYEDYKWQLEKMYRQVPEGMSLGKVRLKPDELLYEEEKWVLGKMFRDLREEDYGYMPTAENQESLLDLCEAIEITPTQFPPEPAPCRPPPTMQQSESMMDTSFPNTGQQQGCVPKVMSPTGKVFEFSYGGMMAVSVDSTQQVIDSSQTGKEYSSIQEHYVPGKPVTPYLLSTNNVCLTQELSKSSLYKVSDNSKALTKIDPSQSAPYVENTYQAASNQEVDVCCADKPAISVESKKKGENTSDRVCKNKLRCESHIQAVCDAARRAMAIYDTVTGCDNFPCNEGDNPEKELDSLEDNVWSWLYQLIFKLTPLDTNQNSLGTIPQEPCTDESQSPREI